MRSIRNIWCMRQQNVYFLISRIHDHGKAWYIVLFGREFWIGPNRPEFIGKDKTASGRERYGK